MTLAIVVLTLLQPLSSLADSLPKERVVVEVSDTAATIKKIQIDLTENKGKWLAKTVSLTDKGEKKTADLPCTKRASGEYVCDRDDNGGGFVLQLTPTPKLTVSSFSADDEGEDQVSTIKAKKGGSPLIFDGKKATISAKDAF
jgi:hypothetical protein